VAVDSILGLGRQSFAALKSLLAQEESTVTVALDQLASGKLDLPGMLGLSAGEGGGMQLGLGRFVSGLCQPEFLWGSTGKTKFYKKQATLDKNTLLKLKRSSPALFEN
jgi:hypothetical protein